MTQLALRKVPSGHTEIDVSVPPQQVAVRRRFPTTQIFPRSETAKRASVPPQQVAVRRRLPITQVFPRSEAAKLVALTAKSVVASPLYPAIQLADPPIADAVDMQPSPLQSVQTLQAAGALACPGSTPKVASLFPIPDDGNACSSSSATADACIDAVAKPTKPRAKRRKTALPDVPVPIEKLKYLTVAQTALRYPAFTQKAIRHLVASSEAHQFFPKAGLKSNGGFINCIVRPAGQRKVIVDADKFELWLSSFSTQ